ncbi:aldehyde ferredoxin oxidoreductase C-terminal domain-containing protein, partial [Chloroflexota bacterium]
YLSCLNAAVGWDMRTDEFLQVGERIFNLKRLINPRQGLNSRDDKLPQRFLTKITDLSAEEQSVPSSLGKYLQEYYALRGWSQDGIPTKRKLKELDLHQC